MGGSRRAVRDTQVIDSIGRVMRWVGRGLRLLIYKASTESVVACDGWVAAAGS